jgi:hypothetical protein
LADKLPIRAETYPFDLVSFLLELPEILGHLKVKHCSPSAAVFTLFDSSPKAENSQG